MHQETETERRRRAGARLLGLGVAFLIAGLIVLVVADARTEGAVGHPMIAKEGLRRAFFAGIPATLGYVLGALGVYRLLEGRGRPGSTLVMVGRVAFGLVATAVFFAGAFYVLTLVRDPSLPRALHP
jgi:hypothetical protein